METQNPKQTYQTWFLVLAILAVISCVPLTGDLSTLLSLVVLGFSIYLLVKVAKDKQRRRGPLLLVIAGGLELVFVILILIAVGGFVKHALDFNAAVGALTAKGKLTGVPHRNLVVMGGEILIAVLFAFASWVVRIIGTVFTFIGYSREKKLALGKNNQQ